MELLIHSQTSTVQPTTVYVGCEAFLFSDVYPANFVSFVLGVHYVRIGWALHVCWGILVGYYEKSRRGNAVICLYLKSIVWQDTTDKPSLYHTQQTGIHCIFQSKFCIWLWWREWLLTYINLYVWLHICSEPEKITINHLPPYVGPHILAKGL